MPNGLTHYVFSEKLLSVLPKTVTEKIKGYEKFYYFASMGGDVLYGLNFSSDKKKREYGNLVHKYGVKESFHEALKKDLSGKQYAFTLGFLSHYVLDSALHPYIFYAETAKIAPNVKANRRQNAHMLIETEIDAYVADRRFGNYAYPTAKLFCWDKETVKATYNFYNDTCKESFNLDLTPADAKLAVSAWKLFTYLLQKGCFLKKGISVIAEKILSSPHLFTAGYRKFPVPPEWDLFNETRASYPIRTNDEGGETDNKTLREQFDLALRNGVKYLTAFVESKTNGDDELDIDFAVNYDGESF